MQNANRPLSHPDLPIFITPNEAADILRTSRKAIYAMIDSVVAEFPVRTSSREITRAADQVARLSWYALYVAEPEDSPRFETLVSLLRPGDGSPGKDQP